MLTKCVNAFLRLNGGIMKYLEDISTRTIKNNVFRRRIEGRIIIGVFYTGVSYSCRRRIKGAWRPYIVACEPPIQ